MRIAFRIRSSTPAKTPVLKDFLPDGGLATKRVDQKVRR
jgi:hypothetical protein